MNGASLLLPESDLPAPLTGFAATQEFTWRNTWIDEMSGATGPARFIVENAGPQSIELSMAEDGLLVYSLALAPPGSPLFDGMSCQPGAETSSTE